MMICETCGSQTVMLLNADFVCDCNIRSLARFASSRTARTLRRAIAFQRGQFPRCDRCDSFDADALVRCYLGCTHAQCMTCVRCTLEERDEGRRYDFARRNGGAPGSRPPQPLHPLPSPRQVDDSTELARRLL